MYKPVSNYNNYENPFQKSLLCSQAEQGEIVAGQLLCCPNDAINKTGKCTDYSSECLTNDKRVAMCHDLTTFTACQRTDSNAARVCGWKNPLLCISTRISSISPDYIRFPEAIKWVVSRNTLEESIDGVMVCDNGQDFHFCNSSSTNNSVATLKCGDLFAENYNCTWTNITNNNGANVHRYPLGELCENFIIPTATTTVTSIPHNDSAPIIGLSAGLGGATLLAAIGFSSFFCWRKKNKTLKETVRKQQIQLGGLKSKTKEVHISSSQSDNEIPIDNN